MFYKYFFLYSLLRIFNIQNTDIIYLVMLLQKKKHSIRINYTKWQFEFLE